MRVYKIVLLLLLFKLKDIHYVNIIILYKYLFYHKNKKIKDNKNIIQDIKNVEIVKTKIDYHNTLKFVWYKLSNYILSKSNFNEFTVLSHVNLVLNNNPHKHLYENKLYWYEFSKKYNINHPTLYMYKQNNKIVNINNIDAKQVYILKPLNGARGCLIKKIKGNEINTLIKNDNNFLIQELLIDENTNNFFRFFRVITLYTGELYLIYEYTNKDVICNRLSKEKSIKNITYYFNNNKLLSKGQSPYTLPQRTTSSFLMPLFFKKGKKVLTKDNNNINISNIEKEELNKIIKKLTNIHKNDYSFMFSIGWDIMFGLNNKVYMLEGNIYGHGVILDKIDKKTVNLYYQKALEFMKKN